MAPPLMPSSASFLITSQVIPAREHKNVKVSKQVLLNNAAGFAGVDHGIQRGGG